MTNSRSPRLTIAPSRKWIESRYPSTRARTSTRSVASKRPVILVPFGHSTTSGGATTTAGGAGGRSRGGLATRSHRGAHESKGQQHQVPIHRDLMDCMTPDARAGIYWTKVSPDTLVQWIRAPAVCVIENDDAT